MKRLLLASAIIAIGAASASHAAISVSLTTGNDATFNNNAVGSYTGSSSALYDGAVGPIRYVAGADTTGASNGTASGVAATPAGDTTNYLWGLNNGTTVYFPKEITSFKIHWGSIDAASVGRYDNLLTLSNGNTISGSDLVALGLADGLGDQFSARDNRWFVIRDTTPFSSFTVTSPQNAFEFDMAVPEPSTWAMMIIGFGALGIATRRQRRRQVVCA
jgi:hypothetical protein